MNFCKMHSLGNDFVIIDQLQQDISLATSDMTSITDRRFGIGCDQLLVIAPPHQPHNDFHCTIYNADGNLAEQCGNGIRCAAAFLYDNTFTTKKQFVIETAGGEVTVKRVHYRQWQATLPPPHFDPQSIPINTPHTQLTYAIDINHTNYHIACVSVGNPHAVIFVRQHEQIDLNAIGASINRHKFFPQGANVGCATIAQPDEITLRVFERGVNQQTLACGSGACAAVVCGIRQGLLIEKVRVHFTRGDLIVEWKGDGHCITLTGGVNYVYKGYTLISNAQKNINQQ